MQTHSTKRAYTVTDHHTDDNAVDTYDPSTMSAMIQRTIEQQLRVVELEQLNKALRAELERVTALVALREKELETLKAEYKQHCNCACLAQQAPGCV
jgi:hypothetical protein